MPSFTVTRHTLLENPSSLAPCSRCRGAKNPARPQAREEVCYPDVGHDLIIDHVLLFREWVDELARDLRAHRVIFVGVFCSSQRRTGTRYPTPAFRRKSGSQ
jgi:hypothetical protein